ncbi:VCBS repeat-containing protein [Plantactinospora sp. KLBMP9567]|uniref:FG-GAP repeat domain-containing protein n=1 Tax=Plantactinospora sp. KLBMP9567 TaxID=3085900 RepID=UPI002980F507|nr:VCBS repeat-containing protein [Plantactinospora sp. KLBMP9567]MDW5328342.1 VCBS repeat-containing protein [Plantactinospora sp. KLBMP9567]
MWKRRLAVLVGGVLIGSLAMGASPARAGIEGDPIWGDLNGDRRLDRVTLGMSSNPDRCAVHVQWSGTGTAEEHLYVPPGATLPVTHCLGMGTAVDLGGDGSVELVLGSFYGEPNGADGSMLVLRNFVPEVLTTADIQLNEIGTADFNGDGLTDVFWWSNQGEGFGTFLNTAAGQLVPGPVKQDEGEINDYQLADFDGNGATDAVIAFHTAPGTPGNGVVVAFDDGTKVWLRQGEDTGWNVEVVDVNADGRPDVRTEAPGEVITWLNRGDRTFDTGPIANDDVAYAYRGAQKVIKVRDNDVASSAAALSIVVPPRYGFLTRHDPRYEVVYQRTATHQLPDTFVYRLTQDGLGDTATVTVRMKD